jgi:quinol monooxygenase YgiN
MIVVIARAFVRPDKREAFLTAARACVSESRKEPGNMAYDFYESATEANRFVFVERWKTHDANKLHLQQAHVQAMLQTAAECVAEMPTIEAITPARIDMLA